MMIPPLTFSPSRREVLRRLSCGFGYTALAGLCGQQALAESTKGSPLTPHFPPKAKRVIFMFMVGGPSHVDTFDYKPQLQKDDGKSAPRQDVGGDRVWLKSPFKFQQHGESGLWISELFPHLAKRADNLCLLNGMHTDLPSHAQGTVLWHTGSSQFVRPSVGAWVLYGLGTENSDLPGFITLNPTSSFGGAQNYGSAFLPASFQGMRIGGGNNNSMAQAKVAHIANPKLSPSEQRRQLDLMQAINRRWLAEDAVNPELEGVIESFEMAFRMQSALPKLMDLSSETQATLDQYGIGASSKPTDNFGRQCLLARRYIEAGVRFVEISYPDWDQHTDLRSKHSANCLATDQPIAALIADLESRGLLEETLIVWGGEFGRTPGTTNSRSVNDGRDHNAQGFTMWMAGGGVKGGMSYGATDEHGYAAVDGKVHIHDLHATTLHLLGLDHEKLTYRYSGRDFRLTDVHGRVIKEILI
ncbi:hypothetical protein ETAA8_42310 [Anatilimnocola aggregata]|uniref:DUF1501 domain-containing protein n=1 Tax=Anatilimnocola aggregata TaxID=2528021 RepID=A0A517YFX7_9BACT|nr:DUF1501 domain-containing protein [Anatilimnocola aggregata]QDU29124.1 hypothetical protein ETAA8_42310 [Anatilimnocola aggregata]